MLYPNIDAAKEVIGIITKAEKFLSRLAELFISARNTTGKLIKNTVNEFYLENKDFFSKKINFLPPKNDSTSKH